MGEAEAQNSTVTGEGSSPGKKTSTDLLSRGTRASQYCVKATRKFSKYVGKFGGEPSRGTTWGSWTASKPCRKLRENNSGQMDPGHSKGPNRICITTLPGHEATRPTLQCRTKQIDRGGGCRPPTKRGGITPCREPEQGWPLLQSIPGSQKRRRAETCHQPKFVQPCHFKMEGIHTLRDPIKQGDWLAKVDLKDAYFTIPIHASQRKYLRFMMAGQAYEFNCLPFGLSSAPWVFTKTLKPVAALLREMGVRMIVYIDDILILAETKEKAQEQAKALVYLLECLGFIINKKKSELTPAQIMDFLGLTVDTVLMQLRLPGGKMKKIRAEARRMEREERVSAHALSRLIGKMNDTSKVIPPAPLFYRHLQMSLTQALD